MSCRNALRLLRAIAFSLVAFVSAVAGDVALAKPNIVFIMADDLGWADTSTALTNLGDPSDFYETPTLERLALEGMAFTNAYANQNCAPTRSALLSGSYAQRSTNNIYQVGSLNRGGNSTFLGMRISNAPRGSYPSRLVDLQQASTTVKP